MGRFSNRGWGKWGAVYKVIAHFEVLAMLHVWSMQSDGCVDGKKTVASGVSRSMCESATMRKFRDGPMRGSS